jgi:hypothetical protein
LSSIQFHGQLKQALLSIQIPTRGWQERGRFVILGLSTWTRATTKKNSALKDVEEMSHLHLLATNIGNKQSP